MITIRSSKNISEPTLAGLEVTLRTSQAVYEFSSNGSFVDPTSPFGGGPFGAISWPRSRFRVGPELTLEQQMFLPHDNSDVAISWELRGKLIPARLFVRPYFAGCSPRSNRHEGFRYDGQEDGGRLSWWPNGGGPKVIADTNGQFHDELPRSSEDATLAATCGMTIAPGTFEFELSDSPSILIFSTDSCARTQRSNQIGAFLAGLLQNNVRVDQVARQSRTQLEPERLVAAA